VGAITGKPILPIMIPPANGILAGSARYDHRRLDTVSQANYAIGKARLTVKIFDPAPQVTQFPYGAAETVFAAYQPHIMPHHVADCLHIALHQRRVRIIY